MKDQKKINYKKRETISFLGERIKKERKSRGLTQDELTKKSKNLTVSSLSKIETSHTKDPSISMVRDIADGLKVKIDDLIKR